MKVGEVFELINSPLKEEDLKPFSKENYSKLNYGLEYKNILKKFKDNKLDVSKLYISNELFSPFWYIDEYAYIEVFTLDMDNDTFGARYIKNRVQGINKIAKKLLNEEKYLDFFKLIEKRFAFSVYQDMYYKIPESERYKIFRDIYINAEYGFGQLNKSFTRNLFSLNNSDSFKEKLKSGYGKSLTIYRGVGSKSSETEKAYSWTLNISTAMFFATRFNDKNPVVYEGKVDISDVIDFIEDRGEEEILIMPENIQDIKKLNLYNLNKSFTEDIDDIITIYNYYKSFISPSWFKNPEGIHGVLHTKRVLLISLILGHLEGLASNDLDILIFCSLFHDIGRTNDDIDNEHGMKSIEKMSVGQKSIIGLNDEDYSIAEFIIKNHAVNDLIGNNNLGKNKEIKDKDRALYLYNIFKDADGLDRVRFKGLDIKYLRNKNSKKLPLVAWQLLQGLK